MVLCSECWGLVDDVLFEIGNWTIWNGTSWDKLTGKNDVISIGIILMYDGKGIANVVNLGCSGIG